MAYRINQYAILFHKKIKKKGPSSQMTLSNQNLNYQKIYVLQIEIYFFNYQKKFEKK